jgi:chemotaxis methyl-accepting protein methylase
MAVWPQPLPPLTDQQFIQWQRLIEARTGIDLSQHRSILQSGLTRRLRELDSTDYDAYYAKVERWPEGLGEWRALVDRIAVKETRFFRQPAAFELLQNYLQTRVKTAATLDLWSAGCATGEEAYGLAIVASEVVARSGGQCFLGVLATDICGEALRRTLRGRFPARRLQQIPEVLRRRYFSAAGADGCEEAVPALRGRLCCAQVNLLELDQLPPLAMDVIFCQNVLVYFRRWRVKRVVDALVERLKPGGLLVLGPGEAPQWQHSQVVRVAHRGVSAYLRRVEN